MKKYVTKPEPILHPLFKPMFKKLGHNLLLLVMAFSWLAAGAQDRIAIRGTVAGENGDPMPGVTIKAKPSNLQAVSDEAGQFEITISSNDATLEFTYMGYKSQEVRIDGRSMINVSLAPDFGALEEVVVIGYGTQKKADLTGAISSISGDEIANFAVPNASQLLQGKAAGVHVASGSGQPGASAVIRIRGLGTVNDNNPLFVVDGQFFDNINNLNPNDVESIQVLKDASSTSIYGSRGSNGVILITTKGGVAGQTITTLDSYLGWKNSYDPPAMMNSEQFYKFITTAHTNAGQTVNPNFEKQYERGFDTDWWKEVNRSALTQNHNFSIMKGGDSYRSYFSLGYMDDQGPVITTDFSRLSLKLKSEYDVSSRLTVGANLGVAKMQSSDANSLPRFDFALQADPFTPVLNPLVEPGTPNYQYNKYAPTEYAFNPNPVSYLEINDRKSKEFNFYGNLFAKLKLFDGLTYSVQANYEQNSSNFRLFRPAYQSTFTEFNMANMESKYRNINDISVNSGVSTNYLIEQRLNYYKTFARHSFDAMVANTFEENESEGINAYKMNTPGNDESFRILSAATESDRVSGDKFRSSILSYLGRLNYSFDDRYLITVNFRADGSSRFAKGHKWGYFPSFAAGWRLSNESFFKGLDIGETLSDLKIRAGWGRTGNQRIDNNAPLTLIGTTPDRQWYFGSGYSQGFLPTNVGNTDIKWETSEQTNIGLDAGLFSNRLILNFNYFIKNTRDMLLRVPIPSIAGYPNYPYSNAGNVENKGFELAVNYTNSKNGFNYSLGGNISQYKNKVTSLGNGGLPLFGSASRTEVGGPMSRFFGYVQQGIFQTTQEIEAYAGPSGSPIQPNATPGDFKFADLNNDGIINDSDRAYVGNPHPDLIFGFNLSLEYKGFDFSSTLQGTLGNDIYNNLQTMAIPGLQNGLASAYTDAWFKEGDHGKYPKPSLSNANNNYRGSSWWVEDGSFMRLQNVQLGYSFKSTLLQRVHLSSFRIYVSGQNLFTITNYTGADPELGSNSALNMGYDEIRYPAAKTIMMGINVKF